MPRDTTDALLQVLLDAPAPEPKLQEIGRVSEIGDGIAIVIGLARALVDGDLKAMGAMISRMARDC